MHYRISKFRLEKSLHILKNFEELIKRVFKGDMTMTLELN